VCVCALRQRARADVLQSVEAVTVLWPPPPRSSLRSPCLPMTEPGRGPGHSGLPRSHWRHHEDIHDQRVLLHHDMAAAVFQTDHNRTSGALYVPPPSPSMSPSPPWKVRCFSNWFQVAMISIVVPYELYELYDWGKFHNFVELYNGYDGTEQRWEINGGQSVDKSAFI